MVSKSNTLPNPMRGLSLLKTARFDAVEVDVMLPEIEGFEKVSPIRAKSDIPILMLKARGAELQPFGRSTKVGPSYGHGARRERTAGYRQPRRVVEPCSSRGLYSPRYHSFV